MDTAEIKRLHKHYKENLTKLDSIAKHNVTILNEHNTQARPSPLNKKRTENRLHPQIREHHVHQYFLPPLVIRNAPYRDDPSDDLSHSH